MKSMLPFFLLALIISACNLPFEPPITEMPVSTESVFTQTPPTPDGNNDRPCAFKWARQDLPELSHEVEQALKDAGLPNAKARAEAYGENCIDENGEVVYFATMETDFHITLKAKDLNNLNELGQLLDTALAVLVDFPPEETPGPQPGYIGIVFEARGEALRLWVMLSKIIQLRQDGLNGAELLQALREP